MYVSITHTCAYHKLGNVRIDNYHNIAGNFQGVKISRMAYHEQFRG